MLKTLNTVANGVVLTVISNLLTDMIYAGYKSIRELKRNNYKIQDEIRNRMNQFVGQYQHSVIDSGVFLEFLQLPQVSDLMCNYIDYIAMGKIQKGKKNFLTKDQLVDYLTENVYRQYSDQITIPDRHQIGRFFDEFFECTQKFYFDVLTGSEKSVVFLINQRLERMEALLRSSLKCEIEERKADMAEVAGKYSEILKRNHQSVFVYGYRDLKLDAFYIPGEMVKKEDIFWTTDYSKNASDLDIALSDHRTVTYSVSTRIVGRHKYNTNLIKYMEMMEPEKFGYRELFREQNIIYVIGGPGYGKSLLLKNFVINYEKVNILHNKGYIVIYCDLKNYLRFSDGKPYPISSFFVESMIEESGLSAKEINEEFLNYYLRTGRCLILLDALDEVPGQHRQKLHKKIVNYLLEFNPNNKICITSRSRGFIPNQDVEVFEILPLNRSQIEDYLNKMIKLNYFSRQNKEAFLEQAQVLIDKGFLNSFLILSLLVSIFRSEKKLPRTKVELYGKCFSYIARERELEKTSDQEKYNWNDVSKLMKDVTFIELARLACPNNRSIDEEEIVERLTRLYAKKFGTEARAEEAVMEFLKFCSERTELFVPAANEKQYKFFHRSFFEYFYSKYIVRLKTAREMVRELKKFGSDAEVCELTIAMLKNDDEERYQELIEYLFALVKKDFVSKKKKSQIFDILTLVMQDVDDVLYIKEYGELFLDYSEHFSVESRYSLRKDGFSEHWKVVRMLLENYIANFPEQADCIFDLYKTDTAAMITQYLSSLGKLFGSQQLLMEVVEYPNDYSEQKRADLVVISSQQIMDELRKHAPYEMVLRHPNWKKYFISSLKNNAEQVLSMEQEPMYQKYNGKEIEYFKYIREMDEEQLSAYADCFQIR